MHRAYICIRACGALWENRSQTQPSRLLYSFQLKGAWTAAILIFRHSFSSFHGIYTDVVCLYVCVYGLSGFCFSHSKQQKRNEERKKKKPYTQCDSQRICWMRTSSAVAATCLPLVGIKLNIGTSNKRNDSFQTSEERNEWMEQKIALIYTFTFSDAWDKTIKFKMNAT